MKKRHLAEIRELKSTPGLKKNELKKKLSELKAKQDLEWKAHQAEQAKEASGSEGSEEQDTKPSLFIEKKISKAEKRRQKKEQEEEEREKRVAEERKTIVRRDLMELAAIERKLQEQSMEIVHIDADGDCLFSSIAYHLNGKSGDQCRHEIVHFIESHLDDFAAFMADEPSAYLSEMSTPGIWGGHIEIMAASKLYKKRIRVVQEHGNDLVFGEDEADPNNECVLTFHRELISLGDHYNTTKHKE